MSKKESLVNKPMDTTAADTKKKNMIESWKLGFLVIFSLIGFCVLMVVLSFVLKSLSVPVSIVMWTVVIVFLLRGIVAFFEKHGVNRVLGAAIAYVVMIAIVAAVAIFMFSPVFGVSEGISNLISEAPKYVDFISNWANSLYSRYSHILNNETVQSWIDSAMDNLANVGSGVAAASAGGIIAAGGAVGTSVMAIGIALVIAFWMLIELPKLGKETLRLIKPKYQKDAKMWHFAFTHVMAGYIKGTFIQCFIIGVCAGILFTVLGIGNSAALGCITGVLNIIPIVGPWIGGAAAAIGGFFTNWVSALIALAGTIAIQQFVYTFISPKIMSDSVDIHPALSLFALTVGGACGGVMSGLMGSLVGMLLSIPAVALFKSLFIYYYEKTTQRRIVNPNGVFFKGIAVGDDTVKPMIDACNPGPKTLKAVFNDEESEKKFAEEWELDSESMDDLREIYKKDKETKNKKKNKKLFSSDETKKSSKSENSNKSDK